MRPTLPTLLSAFLGAGALAGALTAGVDAASTLQWLPALQAAGLGLAHGALQGAGFGLSLYVTAPRKPLVNALAWGTLGLLFGLIWAVGLEVPAKIMGPRAGMAAGTLAATLIVGLAFGTLAALTAPRTRDDARFGRVHGWRRALLVLGLVLTFVAVSMLDRTVPFLPVYPAAETGLRLLGLWSLIFALVWLRRSTKVPRRWVRGVATVLALALCALPFATLPADAAWAIYPIASRPYSALPLGVLRKVVDVDGDGFAGVLGGGDCAPFDSAIHPGVREVPMNGVDEDCVGGDRRDDLRTPDEDVPLAEGPAPMSVLLITVDTLRPDHMSSYGYEWDTTPRIAAWADRRALRFTRAFTPGGWTSMAVTSLMRGIYPRRLRWKLVYETNHFRLVDDLEAEMRGGGEAIHASFLLPIDDPHPTITHWLARRGMTTEAIVDDGRTDFLAPEYGIYAGFDAVHEVDELPEARRTDEGTADVAITRLEALAEGGRPFFLWAHFVGPHTPNQVHRGTPHFGTGPVGDYDHELAFMDEHVGRLIARAEQLEAHTPMAVVFASDHGEKVNAMGRAHGMDVTGPIVHVPLMVAGPGIEAGVATTTVSLVDVVPTLLAMTETPAPSWLDGVDLRGLAAEPDDERVVISELWRFGSRGQRIMDRATALDGETRVVRDLMSRSMQVTDMDGAVTAGRRNAYLGSVGQALRRYLQETGESIHIDE